MAKQSFLEIATSAPVRRRASRIAIVVGSIVVMINQGDALLSGAVTATIAFKMGLTFCVPYCVSTYSSVLAVRDQDV